MRRKTNDRFLARLNRNAVFVRFDDTTHPNENTDSAEAEYFGKVISVSFPNASRQVLDDKECYTTFYLRLYDVDQYGCYDLLEYKPFEQDFATLREALSAINLYIRSRPFTIIKCDRGNYVLLNPFNADYIGEYLTLRDAKRICKHNFNLKL